jgi:hypothetical protein
MLPRWTPDLAARVARHVDTILADPGSFSPSTVKAAQLTHGLLVYGDMGGVIILTPAGEFVMSSHESESVTPVQDLLWHDVALASLGRHFPDLRELLPPRPPNGVDCSTCQGVGWTMAGKLFCGVCRGLGWIASAKERQHPLTEPVSGPAR